MHNNFFMRSAMEQFGEGEGGDAAVTDPITPDNPTEVDTQEQLALANAENDELTQELIQAEGDNGQLVSERVSDEADAMTVAVEALQTLAGVVSASMSAGHYNAYTNAGYAMALEGICNTVHIKGASVTAALEASEIAQYDPEFARQMGGDPDASEKAKSQGIFATILNKLKQIWQGLVRVAKSMAFSFANGSVRVDARQLAQRVGVIRIRLRAALIEGKKGKITDEKFIKMAGVGQGDTINKIMINSAEVIGGVSNFLKDFENQAPGIIEGIKKEPTDNTRAQIQDSIWRLSGELDKAIGGRDKADPRKVIDRDIPAGSEAAASPKLVGGFHIWSIRSKREGGLPVVNIGTSFSKDKLATEITTMEELDFQYMDKTLRYMGEMSEKSPMDKVVQAIQRLDEQFPSSWKKADKIQDVQAYATAAMGYINKSLAAIRGPVYVMLFERYGYVLLKWASLSADALEAISEDEADAAANARARQAETASA